MKFLLRAAGQGAVLLLLAAGVVVGVLGWQINRLGSQDLAQPADAIVILGARVNSDGQPGSDLLSRIYHGMDLYRAGVAPVVICAGGARYDPLAAGSVACRFATQALGLPAEQAWVAGDRDAFSTAEEAEAVASLLASSNLRSVVLVSHPLHLFRARWLFQRQGLEVYTSPTNTNLWRIFPPLRAWYTVREAGGVILTMFENWPLVDRLLAWLNGVVYGA